MDVPSREFVLAGSLEELKAKGRVVLHGDHRPILVIYDRGLAATRGGMQSDATSRLREPS